MGSKHTTIYDVVDILDAYNYLRNNGMTKVTAKTVSEYCSVKSEPTIRRLIDVHESLKYTGKVNPSTNCPVNSIKMVELYNMSKAPDYINVWRKMELLKDPVSVKREAHLLSTQLNAAWRSEKQYIDIHKVFSYIRDGKINDGVHNDQLHRVATAYFDIVGTSDKNHNFNSSAKRTRNTNIDYNKVWEDCLIYNDFKVAEINHCGRSSVTRIRHIYRAVRDNTTIVDSFINAYAIIDAAKNYFNSNNNATNTTITPTICNSALPVELIELLNIENELKQLKVKENDLLLKKDALITALNTLVNN